MEAEGRLKVVCNYPEAAALEDHLIGMKQEIEEFQTRPGGRRQPVGPGTGRRR